MERSRKRPAIFLDRDGTIIEDRGHLSDPAQVVFFDDTVPSLLRLQERFELFVVTNQSGVAKGLVSLRDVERVNAHMRSRLAEAGVHIAEIYVCPHQRSDECPCIKPKPYFLHKAAAEHGVDLCGSWVIGDHPHDLEFGWNAGLGAVYVLSGHGQKHRAELPPGVSVVRGIREAAERVLQASAADPGTARPPCR